MPKKIAFLSLLALVAAVPAMAGNGHFLHGVGAVNSSLGGAGTGMAFEVIGALHANPALLTQLDDYNVGVSLELFTDDLSVTTEAQPSSVLPGGSPRHTTNSDGEPGVIPAVAWSYHRPGSPVAFGWGLLGVAGFRTNFPVDNDSLLLAAQPGGFGRLATDLTITKIPFAAAVQVNPSLSLGASLNVYQGRLIIQPLPVVTPDCNPTSVLPVNAAACYRPGTSGQVSSYAIGLQLGLFYQINPVWSLGLSYTTPQNFYKYEWNSNHADPNNADFGGPRRIGIDIDGPPVASLGFGIRPNPKVKVALDARWVGYHDTNGIGGPGGINQNLQLVSIGWQDIWIGMLGVELQATPKLALRGGININQSPIKPALTINSGGTPSVFEQHYCLGLTAALLPKLNVDLGFYYTPKNEKTGPIITGPGTSLPGSSITLSNSIISGLVGFSFHF